MVNDKTIKIGYFGISAKMESLKTSVREVNFFSGTEINENKDYYSAQLKKILNEMIEINPDKRPCSKEL